jgi:hypothetical protein
MSGIFMPHPFFAEGIWLFARPSPTPPGAGKNWFQFQSSLEKQCQKGFSGSSGDLRHLPTIGQEEALRVGFYFVKLLRNGETQFHRAAGLQADPDFIRGPHGHRGGQAAGLDARAAHVAAHVAQLAGGD